MRRALAISILTAIVAIALASIAWVLHPTAAANVYIAQVAAGGANGTSCANAYPLTFFNTSANWGTGTAQIGPGTTVHLCGTITSQLQAQASGSAGSPITIFFEAGSGITMPALPTSGAIVVSGLSNITIDGGGGNCGFINQTTNQTCAQGSIQATANGTGLANQLGSAAILADNSTNITVQGLLIANVYVHPNNSAGLADDPPRSWCVHAYGTVTNLTIKNNTMHDAAWCVDGGGPGLDLERNEIYNVDHGLGLGGPFTGQVTAQFNHIHDLANWDTNDAGYHHDGLHLFSTGGTITCSPSCLENANIFDGDIGNNDTAWIYNEGDSSVVSGAHISGVIMINNVAIVAAGPSNFGRNSCCGFVDLFKSGSNGVMANNTVTGPGGWPTTQIGTGIAQAWTSSRMHNNVSAMLGGPTTQNTVGVWPGALFVAGGLSGNAYINGSSSNAFSWQNTSDFSSYSQWISLSGETGSQFSTSAQLAINQTTAQPAATSTLCAAGTNLTSLGIAAVNVDFFGNARPSSGNWDVGAVNCASSSSAVVSLSPTSLAFGNQQQSTTSPVQMVTLTNTGSATLTITGGPSSGITITGTNAADFGKTTTCSASVAAGGNCTISVTFTPSTVGAESATLTVTSNATNSPSSVPLTGTGTSPPLPGVGFSPTSVAFGNQTINTTSAGTAITLTNTGGAALLISGITITGTNQSDFRQTNNCPASLGASSTCTITATFTPAAIGARSASLSVADNASGSPQAVPLTGTGTAVPAPVVSLSPTSVNFGSVAIGTTSSSQLVTLQNTGNAALTSIVITLTGTNAADFAKSTTCGSSLAAGSSCTISATFTPSLAATENASVSIADNASNTPQSVPLAGTGTTPTAPVASITPTSLTFASQTIHTTSAGQALQLANTGNATLTITGGVAAGITITGTNAADFSRTTTCTASIAAATNCSVTVKFTPSLVGAESATLNFADNAAGAPQTVPLAGTGAAVPAPAATITPSSLNFGSVVVTQPSSTLVLTLTNTGDAILTVSGITITGTNAADFAQTNNCPVGSGGLNAASFCTIRVTFTPSATGARLADVSVSDNAAGTPHIAALKGVGVSTPASASSGYPNPVLLTQ